MNADISFEEFIKYLTLSVHESYSPAQNLLSLLNSLGSLEAAKITLRLKESFIKMPSLVNTQPKSYAVLTQVSYMLKDYDGGFCYLFPLLNSNYNDIHNLLHSLFETSPDAVSHFEKKLASIFSQGCKNKEKIQSVFLDALCKLKEISNDLTPAALDDLSARYWRSFCNFDAKKEYLEQAILYSLLCAIKWNDPIAVARHRLVDIINTKNAYDIYYSFLIPYLEAGEEQAQDLFNEVAYASPGAFNWFDTLLLATNWKQKAINYRTIDRVMSNYDCFRSQKRSGQSRMDLISPNYPAGFDCFAGETSLVGVYAGPPTLKDDQISPGASASELYKLAMKHMGKDNATAINCLLKAEDKSKDAQKQLGKIREKIKRCKNPSQMETDSLEYFLYQREKDILVLSEKKESKLSSPKSSLIISSKENEPRKKKTTKGKNEGINTITPVSTSTSIPTPTKKERKLQRSKPLETSKIINESTVTNTHPDPIPSEIVSTSVLETPKIDLETVQLNTGAETIPAIQEIKVIDKEPLPVIIVSNDQLPTKSQDESGIGEEIIKSPIPTTEATAKIKPSKTLSRRNSLTLEKATNSKEAPKPRTLHITLPLMNVKPQPQDFDIIRIEEPKRKKKKEHSTKISLKSHLLTRKSEKKLERKNSQNNLLELGSETPQVTSESSQSLSKTPSSFKKLTRLLSDRDLKKKSDVPLTETIINSTFDELKSQGIVDWTRNGNTISATKKDDPEVHITIHAHDKSDKPWSQRPEIISDFLDFSSECDEDLKEEIIQIGKKKKSSKK